MFSVITCSNWLGLKWLKISGKLFTVQIHKKVREIVWYIQLQLKCGVLPGDLHCGYSVQVIRLIPPMSGENPSDICCWIEQCRWELFGELIVSSAVSILILNFTMILVLFNHIPIHESFPLTKCFLFPKLTRCIGLSTDLITLHIYQIHTIFWILTKKHVSDFLKWQK